MNAPDTYVIGIGASAGGLEALEGFFTSMPPDTGAVFVVIQHLSPDYRSLMDELLSRYTLMPVRIASEGLEVEPDHVYLIPPNHRMTLRQGNLHLERMEKTTPRHPLPIDVFLQSMADDLGKMAIGVILSGTGSDGTLGVRALKEAGGMAMVQDADSAKFDGMPRSAIATGLVDYVLPPDRMPAELIAFMQSPTLPESMVTAMAEPGEDAEPVIRICRLLHVHSGIDFTSYKENTILRRIDRRLRITRRNRIEDYLSLLSESSGEREQLVRELLIGVTSFFRDPEAYAALERSVLPKLDFRQKTIRVWSAACSTGEEAYSLAMLMNDYLSRNGIDCELKIFATDVDAKALDVAGTGYYPDSLVAGIEPDRLRQYFEPMQDGWQVRESLRKQIVFARHDLLKDPPFSKLDLLVCRNVFIYLRSGVQQELLKGFCHALKPCGFLMLGSSESLGDLGDALTATDVKWKIYQLTESTRPPLPNLLPLHAGSRGRLPHKPGTLPANHASGIADALLLGILESKLPPSIIIDENDCIVQIIGGTQRYLQVQPGRFSQSLQSNMKRELALLVNNLLRKVRLEKKEVRFDDVMLTEFDDRILALSGSWLEIGRNRYVLVSFEERMSRLRSEPIVLALSEAAEERVQSLESELQAARENLQTTIEELETSNEELQSSNEELIASNEELQSTNEELQSVNEELYTVNAEHQQKILELTDMTNDLANLQKNTDVGALFVDLRLNIRKVTPLFTKIMNILPGDVGRPISHIATPSGYGSLSEEINEVLDTLQGREREIDLGDGACCLLRVRPYRTAFNAVEGVILTLVDITTLKLEQKRRLSESQRLENALDIGRIAWWEYDIVTGHVNYSDRKATMLGYEPHEFPNEVYKICEYIHPDDYEQTMQAMRDFICGVSSEWNITYRMRRKDGTYAYYHDVGRMMERDPEGRPLRLIGSVIDISHIRLLEEQLELLLASRQTLKVDRLMTDPVRSEE